MPSTDTQPQRRRFVQQDVFTSDPLKGNPCAVVIDSQGLTTPQMHAFANWTNLSETTFLEPPTDPTKADYKVRIFTPTVELPFAGHPTLASCRSALDYLLPQDAAHRFVSGNSDVITQECPLGLIKIKRQGNRLALAAPDFLKYQPATEEEISAICKAMKIDRSVVLKGQHLDNGPGWLGLLLNSAEDVLKVTLKGADLSGVQGMNFGLVGPYASALPNLQRTGLLPSDATAPEEVSDATFKEPAAHFELRTFFEADGFMEDPVTGSFNAGVAKWLMDIGAAPEKSYVASQGTAMGRKGRIYVEKDEEPGCIWIAGGTVEVIAGTVTL